jgi:hypothetical protein
VCGSGRLTQALGGWDAQHKSWRFVFPLCGVASAEALPNSLLQAISARLRADQPTINPIVIAEQSCSQLSNSPIAAPDFRSRYPQGVYVVCDAQTNGASTNVTVLRYLYHSSGGPLVARRIEASLLSHEKGWRIEVWSATAIDYAP